MYGVGYIRIRYSEIILYWGLVGATGDYGVRTKVMWSRSRKDNFHARLCWRLSKAATECLESAEDTLRNPCRATNSPIT